MPLRQNPLRCRTRPEAVRAAARRVICFGVRPRAPSTIVVTVKQPRRDARRLAERLDESTNKLLVGVGRLLGLIVARR